MFQENLLTNKRVLVTGGGSGLGKEISRYLLQLDAEVVICGRRENVLSETATELGRQTGGRIDYVPLDIRDPEAVDEVIEKLFTEKPINCLVNNAAGNFLSRTEDLSHRAMDAIFSIVLHGTSYATLACGKRWLKRSMSGNVVSIVTTYAWTGSGYVVPSAMAKAGVLAMTRSLAVEWGQRGIRLNAVAPGPFPTEGAWSRLFPNADVSSIFETRNPLGRVGKKEELCGLTAFLLADQSGYINGEVVTIDGGEWLKGAGQFNFASELSDEDWAEMKKRR